MELVFRPASEIEMDKNAIQARPTEHVALWPRSRVSDCLNGLDIAAVSGIELAQGSGRQLSNGSSVRLEETAEV